MDTFYIIISIVSVNLALVGALAIVIGVERRRQRRQAWWRGK